MRHLPSGTFASSYTTDAALVRTRKQWLALAALLVVLALVPPILGPRYTSIGNNMFIMAVIVTGLQLTLGYAGQVNLAQAAFMGVGAFTAASLANHLALPLIVILPMAGAAAALFGLLFGLAAVRIKGFYMALTTITAQFVFHFAVINMPTAWFGAANGLKVPPLRLFGLTFNGDLELYYLNGLVAIAMIAFALGIARGRFGRAFVAVRDDDVAAGMMGINGVRTKAFAFMVGTFYAGVGGALWAYYIRYVGVEQFTLFNSIWMIAMLIVGGMGSIVGGLFGVVVIVGLQEVVTSLGPRLADLAPDLGGQIVFASMNVLLGLLIALFLILEPKGLMHRWQLIRFSLRIWPFPH
jgi:branched-chain amino acid transport system permease protein